MLKYKQDVYYIWYRFMALLSQIGVFVIVFSPSFCESFLRNSYSAWYFALCCKCW